MNRRIGITVLIAVVVAVVTLYLGVSRTDRHYMIYTAIIRAERIVAGCRTYFLNPNSGMRYPNKLADLTQPPFGGNPLLDESELLDPWGNPYKYAVVPNERDEPELYVWSERTVDGHTTLHGSKRAVGGTPVRFGLPERR